MKLWFLRPHPDLRTILPGKRDGLGRVNPWRGDGYNVMLAVILRAESEQEARQMAQAETEHDTTMVRTRQLRVWLRPEYSICEELTGAGKPGVVMMDKEPG